MRTDRKDLFKHRFQKHYPRLCSIAYGYVLDRDESEDIVQEVFIHIWDKGKDDLPEQEFLAYLTTAVKNNCISFLRKRKDSPASLEDYPLADTIRQKKIITRRIPPFSRRNCGRCSWHITTQMQGYLCYGQTKRNEIP